MDRDKIHNHSNNSNLENQPQIRTPIHLDKRVFKGSTQSTVIQSKFKSKKDASIDSPQRIYRNPKFHQELSGSNNYNNINSIQKKLNASTARANNHQSLSRANLSSFNSNSIYDLRPEPPEKRPIDLMPYLIDEEDSKISTNFSVNAQTDEFQYIEPTNAKMFKQICQGSNVEVQTNDLTLNDFETEVMPVLEVLADKTLEQARQELNEAEEIANVDKFKREIKEIRKKRQVEILEMESLEIYSYSQQMEKVTARYFPYECTKYLEYKIHSTHNGRSIVNSISKHVFQDIIAKGYTESWSKISLVSEGKKSVINTVLDRHEELNALKNYIEEMIVKSYYEFALAQRKKNFAYDTLKKDNLDLVSKNTNYTLNLAFRYPYCNEISFKKILQYYIENRESIINSNSDTPFDIDQFIDKKLRNNLKERNFKMYDPQFLEQCEYDESEYTSVCANCQTGLGWREEMPPGLNIEHIECLKIRLVYDDRVLITASQSMINFELVAFDHDGRLLFDCSESVLPSIHYYTGYDPQEFEKSNEIYNEKYNIKIKDLFANTQVYSIILYAKVKVGYKDFFDGVKCKVYDEYDNVYYDEFLNKYFSLEKDSTEEGEKMENQRFVITKVSKRVYSVEDNKSKDLEIKKERYTEEIPTVDDPVLQIVDLKGKEDNRPFNVYLYPINLQCSYKEIELLPEMLNYYNNLKRYNPVVLRFNPFSWKNEIESRKTNKKGKKPFFSDLFSKCYDYVEYPLIKDFTLKNVRLPGPSHTYKQWLAGLEKELDHRIKHWRLLSTNSYNETFGLFYDGKLINSTETLYELAESNKKIEIHLMSAQDLADFSKEDVESEEGDNEITKDNLKDNKDKNIKEVRK